MKTNKGFTLIELLAVIIILGLLMLIAIPSVTAYINNSRKEAYIDTAKQYIKGAVNLVNGGNLDIYDTETTYYIPSTCIELETGGHSPYGGDFAPAYILVTYDNDSYKYYWMSRDEQSMGIKTPVLSNNLKTEDIVSGVKESDISVKYLIDGRENLIEFTGDCSSQKAAVPGTVPLTEDGESTETPLTVGNYISITPTSTSYTIPASMTGYESDQTINPSELTLWRVISIDNRKGTIDAVSEYTSSTDVYFTGTTGFANYVGTLQNIAKQYVNSKYVKDARMMGYDGQTLVINDVSKIAGPALNIVGTQTTPSPMSGTGEEYAGGLLGDTLYLKDYLLVTNACGTTATTIVNDQSTTGMYWIASRRYHYLSYSYFYFTGRFIVDSHIGDYSYSMRFYNSGWINHTQGRKVRPIITLKPGLKIDSGTGAKNSPYVLK